MMQGRGAFPGLSLLIRAGFVIQLQTDLLNFNLDLLKSDMPTCAAILSTPLHGRQGAWPCSGAHGSLPGLQNPRGKVQCHQCSWSVDGGITKAGSWGRRPESSGRVQTSGQNTCKRLCIPESWQLQKPQWNDRVNSQTPLALGLSFMSLTRPFNSLSLHFPHADTQHQECGL